MVDNILTAPINSVNKENILAYIGGYIIRKLSKKIDCSFCFEAMLSNESVKHRFLSLVALKDRGGLIYPSEDVLKILNISERVFKGIVCGLNPNNLQINASRNLRLMLINKVMFESTNVFECLQQHDIENRDLNEDCYSTQIIKSVVYEFLTLRLLRYGQDYTQNIQKNCMGQRHQLNKLVLFK